MHLVTVWRLYRAEHISKPVCHPQAFGAPSGSAWVVNYIKHGFVLGTGAHLFRMVCCNRQHIKITVF